MKDLRGLKVCESDGGEEVCKEYLHIDSLFIYNLKSSRMKSTSKNPYNIFRFINAYDKFFFIGK